MSSKAGYWNKSLLAAAGRVADFSRLDFVANLVVQVDNPLCGDEGIIYLKVTEGRIVEVAAEIEGCSIHKAATVLLLEELAGAGAYEAIDLLNCADNFFVRFISGKKVDSLPKSLEALSGVIEYPIRIKCARLTMKKLLEELKNFLIF